jgi:Glycosyl transferases group 1
LRILLAQNVQYYPSHRGGCNSDRLLLKRLVSRGHTCRVIARIEDSTERGQQNYIQSLKDKAIVPDLTVPEVVRFALDGVDVHTMTTSNIRVYCSQQLGSFHPDVTLISTDPLNILIHDLTQDLRSRFIYMARTTSLLPFGPDSSMPSEIKTGAVRRAHAVVAVSQHLAEYIKRHANVPAVHVPIQEIEHGGGGPVGSIDNAFISMINPCDIKGIDIFTTLADAFPGDLFAAVPTWGTTKMDKMKLASRVNIRILEPFDDIAALLVQTRVMLVPSLWEEGRGRIVVESMLNGVPVLASDHAGIREAAMGVCSLIPIRPIASYGTLVNERMMRTAVVPPQDIEPWKSALRHLLTDRDYYQQMSETSRSAALKYAREFTIDPFESLLRRITNEFRE